MSHTPAPIRQTSRNLLAQLLEEPDLTKQIARLDGEELKYLVAEVGLEDSGELLALASPHQLLALFDEALWTSDEADEELLDLELLVTLLEVLQWADPKALAEKLTTLSEEFVVLAVGSLVSVWPTDFIEAHAEADPNGQVEKKLMSQYMEEFDNHLVLSRSGDGWDTVVDLLTTWNQDHPELLERILLQLSAANVSEVSEPDELISALEGMDEVRELAVAEREERRAAKGYVSISDARAFLRLPPSTKKGERDAISNAYFRRLRALVDSERPLLPHRKSSAVSQLLSLRRVSTALLPGPDRPLKLAMQRLKHEAPALHTRFVDELAFLVNVLLANSTGSGGALGLEEALAEVSACIEAGAGLGQGENAQRATDELAQKLEEWTPLALFRKGFSASTQ